jgi:hypothetical protein
MHAVNLNLKYTLHVTIGNFTYLWYSVHFKTLFIFLGKKLHLHGCLLKVTGSDIECYSQTGYSVPMSCSSSVSVPLYTIITHGRSPHHIVCQFQSPYVPSPPGLVGIGFTFLLHVIVPDKTHGEAWRHCQRVAHTRHRVSTYRGLIS